MNYDDEFLLGLRKGESIPMERHGEMGMLYRPTANLSENEMILFSNVWSEADKHYLDGFLKLGLLTTL